MTERPPQCHICEAELTQPTTPGIWTFWCPRCGPWNPLEREARATLREWLGDWDAKSLHRRSRLSHLVRRQQRPDFMSVGVPLSRLGDWGLDDQLPTPAQQLDNFVLWLGEHQASYARRLPLDLQEVSAWIGAPIQRDEPTAPVLWLAGTPAFKQLISHSNVQPLGDALTMEGWQRFHELQTDVSDSRTAFMAMKFGDAQLDMVVERCFKPAAVRAGFTLRKATDEQPAGLIDAQMRVAIRTARFVVADLTHGSAGAYWEAGFAEGLGRPVIYTCRQSEWQDHSSHFDTNHLVTLLWDTTTLADMDKAERQLLAIIRATLPAEANMKD